MYGFLKFNFSYFTTQVKLFFAQKRIPKNLGCKNVMKRGIKKNSHFRNRLNCISNFFGKIILKPL